MKKLAITFGCLALLALVGRSAAEEKKSGVTVDVKKKSVSVEAKVTEPSRQRHGVASKESKLVPSMATRSRTLGANKLPRLRTSFATSYGKRSKPPWSRRMRVRLGSQSRPSSEHARSSGSFPGERALAHAANSIRPCPGDS